MWHSWQRGICKLQILLTPRGFESLSLRQIELVTYMLADRFRGGWQVMAIDRGLALSPSAFPPAHRPAHPPVKQRVCMVVARVRKSMAPRFLGSILDLTGCGAQQSPIGESPEGPKVLSLAPASGSGRTHVFAAEYLHTRGSTETAGARVLFNRRRSSLSNSWPQHAARRQRIARTRRSGR
jgi:hypothetical protein